MKTALATIALLASLAATAQTGEEQERLQQQPPVVTERQVQRDANRAAEVRSANDKVPDNDKQLKAQQATDMKENRKDANLPVKTKKEKSKGKKKSSTNPEKQ